MAVIDTSLLYALFNEGDEFHAEAKLLVAANAPVLVSPAIAQEVLGLLHHRHGAEKARAALAWMSANGPVNVLDDGTLESFQQARTGFAAAGSLSFADVWCIAYARHHGLGLLTKDRRQAKAFAKWTTPK